jgi:transposase
MYGCILNRDGAILVHRHLQARPEALRTAMAPSRDDLALAVEWMFAWNWRADRCAQAGLPFVLGHALYMKAIHGGKTKHDKIDAHKIAVLRRGGMRPQASGYPAARRATRDWLRRRLSLRRQRAALLAHVQNTNSQYHPPEIGKKLAYKANRTGVADRFPAPSVRKTAEGALPLIDYDEERLREVERYIVETAKHHAVQTFYRLRSTQGVGKILALVPLDELQDITRFPRAQEFVSSARLVQCPRESAGTRAGPGGQKLGTGHLKWAFAAAAVLFLRNHPLGQAPLATLARKRGTAKALSILAHHLGRAVSFLLKRHEAFDMHKLLAA